MISTIAAVTAAMTAVITETTDVATTAVIGVGTMTASNAGLSAAILAETDVIAITSGPGGPGDKTDNGAASAAPVLCEYQLPFDRPGTPFHRNQPAARRILLCFHRLPLWPYRQPGLPACDG